MKKQIGLVPIAALVVAGMGVGRAGAQSRSELERASVDKRQDLGYMFEDRRDGMLTFSVPATAVDGFGDGPFDGDPDNTVPAGHRPTLQGNGTFLRVNGLDAQSCNECHTIVRQSTEPPTLGIGGVGGLVQSAIILPSMIDVADSQDDRTRYAGGHDPDIGMSFDGSADFNGRLANPPFLFGGGGVEALGKEMTANLQRVLRRARRAPPGTIHPLDTHGVSFGFVVAQGGGEVSLSPEGIGPEHIEGVAPEDVLVVRPFGRKGENPSMRDFDRGAMQFHFGRQPVEVVGPGVDPDGDGVVDEVTVETMQNLHVFDVTNPRPFMEKLNGRAARGFEWFKSLGCASCHRPLMQTRSNRLPLAHPEVFTDPDANVYRKIKLTDVGFVSAPHGGVYVPLFSDLKRHDMGPRLAETFERGEIPNSHFITARLWGIADTAPYLHDGRALTLFDAIEMHGGEAQAVRDAFLGLSSAARGELLEFLGKLRTPVNPNEDLVTRPWRAGVSYTVGQVVNYEGQSYECRQSHVSQVDWTPPATPALWLVR